MMCNPSSPKMTLHSLRADVKTISMPKSVMSAQRWLMRHAPLLYSKTASYRNAKIVEYYELTKIEFYCRTLGYNWNKVKSFFERFVNIKKEEIIPN